MNCFKIQHLSVIILLALILTSCQNSENNVINYFVQKDFKKENLKQSLAFIRQNPNSITTKNKKEINNLRTGINEKAQEKVNQFDNKIEQNTKQAINQDYKQLKENFEKTAQKVTNRYPSNEQCRFRVCPPIRPRSIQG